MSTAIDYQAMQKTYCMYACKQCISILMRACITHVDSTDSKDAHVSMPHIHVHMFIEVYVCILYKL